MDAAIIRDRLKRLSTYEHALDFFGDLGYSYAGDDPLYRGDWAASAQNLPVARLGYLARHQQDFHIIYCELSGERLLRTIQRPLIEQIARRHPFFMIAFRNQPGNTAGVQWEFVNVRVIQDADEDKGTRRTRRVARRISIGPAERLHDRLHTAAQRLALIDISGKPGVSALELQNLHDRAFDVEAVTNAFFATYRDVFKAVEASITGISGDTRRLFTQRLFNRLMFIIFLEHKGWLRFQDRPDYLYALWDDYEHTERPRGQTTFYQARLIPLFFAGLNTPNEVNIMGAGGHRQGIMQDLIGDVPYLNGGLFEEEPEDCNPAIVIPDAVIRRILDELFYHFNFTVAESTPQEIEVAVDPEMLGRIFEELVTGRHETGSYYTPKPVVSFMGREALKGYLQNACPHENPDALTAFIDQRDPSGLSDSETVLDALKAVHICDPACGSGAYLLGMLHELIDLRACLFATQGLDSITVYQRKLEIIQHNLYGVDIDPFAVNIARLRLWLSLIVDFEGDNPPPLPNLDFKIETGDSLIAPDPSGGLQPDMFRRQQIQEFLRLKGAYLTAHHGEKLTLRGQIEAQRAKIAEWARADAGEGFDWAVEFAEVFHAADGAGGFDIVLANPPYVRQELIKEQKPALKRAYGNLYTGTADLYVYFYLRALQLLRPGGMLVFISSNKWLRAGYGAKLRELLATSTTLHSLIDFGDLPLFGAIAYPMIVVARKQPPPADDAGPHALPVSSLDVLNDLTAVVQSSPPIPQRRLRPEGWQFADHQILALMEKLRAAGASLGQYANEEFYRGLVTGLNEAFVIDQSTRDGLVAEDPRSAEIIKPWLRGKDIKRWGMDKSGLYLILSETGINIEDYPAILSHLQRFRNALANRWEPKRGLCEWYELRPCAYYAQFERPKITFPDIAPRPYFTLETDHAYIDATLCCIPREDPYLLGILNSSCVDFFYRQISPAIQGGFLRFKVIYYRNIPIPNASQDLRSHIESIVRKLLALRRHGPHMAELEAELNRLVYQAYDLTTEEIHLIEGYPTIESIREAHPNKWLVVEVTDRDEETLQPLRGILRYESDDRSEAMEASRNLKGRRSSVFYSGGLLDSEEILE